MVTHYQRLLDYVMPDVVHVHGRRPDRQDRRAASWRCELEKTGYAWAGDKAPVPLTEARS